MKILKIGLLVSLVVLMISCQEESNSSQLDAILSSQIKQYSKQGTIEGMVLPSNTDYDAIPQDPRNPLTAAKVNLGQMLFHETAIGSVARIKENKFTYSCASCHHAAAGFQACLSQGIGEGGLGFGLAGESRKADLSLYKPEELDVQPIRSPTAMNGAYQTVMLWNGQFGATDINIGTEHSWTPGSPKEKNKLGFEGLETQAIAGLDVHRMRVDNEFVDDFPEYKAMFDEAFADVPQSERYNNVTAGLAIAAYERTILSTEAPFQRWLKGDLDAMTASQKRGAILFFGRAKCYTCHDGPALNSNDFYALGMNDLDLPGVYAHGLDDATKKGRGGFTKKDNDLYKYKVPQLYSLKYSPFYGHGASFNSVEDVIKYKNRANAENINVPAQYISDDFKPLGLNPIEISELTDFVLNGLDDKNLQRYNPSSLPSGLCFPNNDSASKLDLGCN